MKKILLALMVVFSSLIIWAPFFGKINLPFWNIDFSEGSRVLWKNFDGPNYVIVEKTWYDQKRIKSEFSAPQPAEYYAAHLPFYPAAVWVFDQVMSGPRAMLLATLLGSVLCFLMFYKYLVSLGFKNAMWFSMIFLVFPFRWLAVRTIGSPEPWFIFFILASMYHFKKKSYGVTAFFTALAMLTKSPGVLLLAAYGIHFFIESARARKPKLEMWPLSLAILAVPLLFTIYFLRTGDWLAYFHSGDNLHLFWPPFSIFSPKGQYWVGNFWLEDVLWMWLVYGIGVMKLKEKKLMIEYYFAGIFFVSTLFVAHRDIGRYILPIAPFMIIGWEKLLAKREAKILLALLLVPTILYTWNFLLNNMAPVADWAPYL